MIPAFRALSGRSLFVGHSGPSIIALTAVMMASGASAAWGQSWTCAGDACTTTGKVGVGTASPATDLQVGNADAGFASFFFNGGGVMPGAPGFGLAIGTNYSEGDGETDFWNEYAVGPGAFQFKAVTGGGGFNDVLTIKQNGNVGIGTTRPCYTNAPPGCKLSVAGAIQAQEIVVNAGWSDYVFEPNYRLSPLTEVAAYIQANHRLPDIPSETEVKEKGVSLGDMQAKLLAKVEELTLHMIQADERNNRLEQQNRELRDRISRLEKGAANATPTAAK